MVMVTSCENLNKNIKREKIILNEKKREYLIYFPNPTKDLKPTKVLFFLHGLLNPKEVSSQFLQIVQAVKYLDSLRLC